MSVPNLPPPSMPTLTRRHRWAGKFTIGVMSRTGESRWVRGCASPCRAEGATRYWHRALVATPVPRGGRPGLRQPRCAVHRGTASRTLRAPASRQTQRAGGHDQAGATCGAVVTEPVVLLPSPACAPHVDVLVMPLHIL